MAVKDDNNGAWRSDTAGHCSTFIACLFHEFAEKGWDAQELRRFVVFITALKILIANY